MTRALRPYPEYKDSGVPWLGKVPEHWEVRALGRIGRFSKGNGGTKEDEVDDGVPCIRYGDLYTQHQFFVRRSRACVSEEKAPNYTPILHGDVLFAGSGETVEEIGKSAVNLISGPACCGGDVILFRPSIALDASFLGYASDCPQAAYQKSCMGRGVTVMHIYGDELKYMYVGLAPPAEQAAIVRFLGYVDRRVRRYIRGKQRLIELLEERRMDITAEALRSPRVKHQRLEVVVDVVSRPVDRSSQEAFTPIGLYNRGRGIFHKEPRRGDELGDSDFSWIGEGDLVISGQFAWEGAVALARDEDCGCVASHRYPILHGRPDILSSGYLLAFFQTGWGNIILNHHSRGAAGRNRPLNVRTLLKEKIPVPSFDAQQRIAVIVQQESVVRQQVADWVALLNEYRTRLVADVATGKLDVREAAAALPDEPEEVEDTEETEELLEDEDALVTEGAEV